MTSWQGPHAYNGHRAGRVQVHPWGKWYAASCRLRGGLPTRRLSWVCLCVQDVVPVDPTADDADLAEDEI